MAQDIKLIWDSAGMECDIDFDTEVNDIVYDEGLETAALMSLWSDKRADDDDAIDDQNDKRGWWGDLTVIEFTDQIGSKLWQVARGKTTAETLVQAKQYIEEALEWMIEDGVAARITAEAERSGPLLDRLYFKVSIYKNYGSVETFLFDLPWQKQFGG